MKHTKATGLGWLWAKHRPYKDEQYIHYMSISVYTILLQTQYSDLRTASHS